MVERDELSWDVRDAVEYDYSVGVTIERLLDEGRWEDEGVLLRYAAHRLMAPKIAADIGGSDG